MTRKTQKRKLDSIEKIIERGLSRAAKMNIDELADWVQKEYGKIRSPKHKVDRKVAEEIATQIKEIQMASGMKTENKMRSRLRTTTRRRKSASRNRVNRTRAQRGGGSLTGAPVGTATSLVGSTLPVANYSAWPSDHPGYWMPSRQAGCGSDMDTIVPDARLGDNRVITRRRNQRGGDNTPNLDLQQSEIESAVNTQPVVSQRGGSSCQLRGSPTSQQRGGGTFGFLSSITPGLFNNMSSKIAGINPPISGEPTQSVMPYKYNELPVTVDASKFHHHTGSQVLAYPGTQSTSQFPSIGRARRRSTRKRNTRR